MKVAHFYAYGVIGEQVTAEGLSSFLQSLSEAKQEILVHIDSPGGNVEQAFAMRDLLNASKLPVNTIVEGKCYSAAPILFLAGKERTVTNDSVLMLHSPFIQPTGEAFTGDDLMSVGSAVKAIENKMAMTIVNATGGDEAQIKELMRVETFITPQQALELKIATNISEPVKAMAFLDTKHNKENSEMSKELKTLGAKIDAAIAFITGKAKNMDVVAATYTTDDGNTLNIEGEVVQGSNVSDKEGAATPNATYKLADGRTIKTNAESKIEEVIPAEEAKAEDVLKAENETLKSEIADLKSKVEDFEKTVPELQAKFTALAKEIQSKHTVQTGGTAGLSEVRGTAKVEEVNAFEEAKKRKAEREAKKKK